MMYVWYGVYISYWVPVWYGVYVVCGMCGGMVYMWCVV